MNVFQNVELSLTVKKHNKNPWMTVGILKSINQRNKLYKKFKQTSINSISYVAKKTMFNRYRNTLKKTITLAKLVYYKNIFDRYKHDMKKLYRLYKLYRNRLPSYFEMFLPEYGAHRHNLRNDLIRLPAIRCEFGEMNAKYQMQLRLRDLASPANPPKYPSIHINEDILTTSMHQFSSYLKMKFVNSYPNMCNLEGCFVCLNLN